MSKIDRKMDFWISSAMGPTGARVKLHVRRDLAIGPDIDKELREQGALYAWYAALRNVAKQQLAAADVQIKETYDSLFIKLVARPADGKRVLKANIETAIRSDSFYKHLQQERLRLQFEVDNLNDTVEAFKHRSFALDGLCRRPRRGDDSDLPDSFDDESKGD